MKDGFPTNRELQVQFTAGARDVFVAATERKLQYKVSEFEPWALGKPLDHLQLVVCKRHGVPRRPGSAGGFEERLFIAPLQPGSADELFDDSEEYLRDYYRRIAQAVANTAITDTLRFNQLTSSMIDAAWSVSYVADERDRGRVNSFMKEPLRQNLVRANRFVEEAVGYARHSSLFDKDSHARRDEYNLGYSDDDPMRAIRHGFYLSVTPRLPINGHESQEFIRHYVDVMEKGMQKCQAELTRQMAYGTDADDDTVDALSEELDSYVRAKLAAEKFLT